MLDGSTTWARKGTQGRWGWDLVERKLWKWIWWQLLEDDKAGQKDAQSFRSRVEEQWFGIGKVELYHANPLLNPVITLEKWTSSTCLHGESYILIKEIEWMSCDEVSRRHSGKVWEGKAIWFGSQAQSSMEVREWRG